MNQIIETFESLPKIAKILLLIFVGAFISPIYRILRYLETKNTTTLVVGIICLFTGCGNVILAILDIISEIQHNRITMLAD